MVISKGTLNKLVTQPTPVPLHPALNLRLHGKKTVSNCLSYGMSTEITNT